MRSLLLCGALALLALALAPGQADAIDPRVCTSIDDWPFIFNVVDNRVSKAPRAASVMRRSVSRIFKQMIKKRLIAKSCTIANWQAVSACFQPDKVGGGVNSPGDYEMRYYVNYKCGPNARRRSFQVWPSPHAIQYGKIDKLPWDYQVLPNGRQILTGSN